MIDIEKQVVYWRNGASEDWQVARDLIRRKRTRQGLFFAHLALEKALKAHVCRQTQDLAPRMHNLVRLAELAGFQLDEKQLDILAEMNAFNIEGRYPEMLLPETSIEDARGYMRRARKVYTWLMKQLQEPSDDTSKS
jgi:HEPN domain-containing protein